MQTLTATLQYCILISLCGGRANSQQVVTARVLLVTVDKGRVLLVVGCHYLVYSQATSVFMQLYRPHSYSTLCVGTLPYY